MSVVTAIAAVAHTKNSSGSSWSAGLAAAAAVGAALIGAVAGALLNARRERKNWAREARAAAYLDTIDTFHKAMTIVEDWTLGRLAHKEMFDLFEAASSTFEAATSRCELLASYATVESVRTLALFLLVDLRNALYDPSVAMAELVLPPGGFSGTTLGARLQVLETEFLRNARRDLSVPWRRRLTWPE
jgi:hypothetical protein